ncbi:hypothetical protein MMC34_007416 [Xylographa carneopallida]|nr:hypothetical protein [Xylographa carneopallida]
MGLDHFLRRPSIPKASPKHFPSLSTDDCEIYAEPAWPRERQPYVVLLSGFIMMMNSWGLVMSYGAFMGLFDEHLLPSTSTLTLSLPGSFPAFLILLLSLIAGPLLDAHLHRYLAATGFTLTTAAYLALSFTCGAGSYGQGTYWAILLCFLLAGLGQACFFVASSQNATQWFPHRRCLAIGITSAGAAVGGILYPLAIRFLVGKYAFPTGIRILASLVGSTGLVAALFGQANPTAPRRALGPLLRPSTWLDPTALRSGPFLAYAAGVACIFAGFFALPFFVTNWAQNRGLGVPQDIVGGDGELPSADGPPGIRSYWFLIILNGSSAVGRVAGSWVAMRAGDPLVTQAAFCVLTALLALLMWPLAGTTAAAVAFSVLYGVFGGGVLGLVASVVAELVPGRSKDCVGQWTGMLFVACAVPALVGPLVGGALYARYGQNAVGWFTGGALLAAAAWMGLGVWLRRREERRVGRGKEGGAEVQVV